MSMPFSNLKSITWPSRDNMKMDMGHKLSCIFSIILKNIYSIGVFHKCPHHFLYALHITNKLFFRHSRNQFIMSFWNNKSMHIFINFLRRYLSTKNFTKNTAIHLCYHEIFPFYFVSHHQEFVVLQSL